jgi:hypothetical protein
MRLAASILLVQLCVFAVAAVAVLVTVEPLPAPALVASLESGSMYEPRRLAAADSPPPCA